MHEIHLMFKMINSRKLGFIRDRNLKNVDVLFSEDIVTMTVRNVDENNVLIQFVL